MRDAQRPRLLALGDSVAAGYGLEDAGEGYPALLAAALGGTVVNRGVSGSTSGELLEALRDGAYDEALGEADIVLVSVGANDLLRVLTLSSSGTDAGVTPPELYLELTRALFGDGASPYGVAVIARRLAAHLEGILAYLREKNPAATLIFNNLFNPYGEQTLTAFGKELPLGALSDACIRLLNRAYPVSDGYILADVYTAMNHPGLTRAILAEGNFDPHPNAAGHRVIAAAVARAAGLPQWRPGRGEEGGDVAAAFALRREYLPPRAFAPRTRLTWGEALAALAAFSEEPLPGGRAADWARERGIINGFPFAADEPIRREQLCRLAAAYLQAGTDLVLPAGPLSGPDFRAAAVLDALSLWPGGGNICGPATGADLSALLLRLSNLLARSAP